MFDHGTCYPTTTRELQIDDRFQNTYFSRIKMMEKRNLQSTNSVVKTNLQYTKSNSNSNKDVVNNNEHRCNNHRRMVFLRIFTTLYATAFLLGLLASKLFSSSNNSISSIHQQYYNGLRQQLTKENQSFDIPRGKKKNMYNN